MTNDALTSSDRWAIAFTARLLELQPHLGLAGVVLVCEKLFAEVPELDPVEVAETYAASCVPNEKQNRPARS